VYHPRGPPSTTAADVNQASAAVPTGTGDPVPGNNQAEDVDFLELPLFCDGFDSGGTTFWSGAMP